MRFIDLLTEVKMYEGMGLPADSIMTLDQFVNSSGLEEANKSTLPQKIQLINLSFHMYIRNLQEKYKS